MRILDTNTVEQTNVYRSYCDIRVNSSEVKVKLSEQPWIIAPVLAQKVLKAPAQAVFSRPEND
jgi:hypothetical protein